MMIEVIIHGSLNSENLYFQQVKRLSFFCSSDKNHKYCEQTLLIRINLFTN